MVPVSSGRDEGPGGGRFVIVADGSQRLYKRNKVTWISLGIKATGGRSISARFDLDKNYRNTPRIATLARNFSADERNVDGINSIGVDRKVAVGFRLEQSNICPSKKSRDQVEDALKIVGHWLRGERKGKDFAPIEAKDIGVFYPMLYKGERALMQRLVDGLKTPGGNPMA